MNDYKIFEENQIVYEIVSPERIALAIGKNLFIDQNTGVVIIRKNKRPKPKGCDRLNPSLTDKALLENIQELFQKCGKGQARWGPGQKVIISPEGSNFFIDHEKLELNPAYCLIARLNGEVVGASMFTNYDGVGEIKKNVISPEQRSRAKSDAIKKSVNENLMRLTMAYLLMLKTSEIYIHPISQEGAQMAKRYGFQKNAKSENVLNREILEAGRFFLRERSDAVLSLELLLEIKKAIDPIIDGCIREYNESKIPRTTLR